MAAVSGNARQAGGTRGGRTTDAARRWWVRIEFALVLAEATSQRLGSVRQLKWDDFDNEHRVIRWRSEADRKGRERVVPVPESLMEEVRRFRRALASVGRWVFSADESSTQATDRDYLDKRLRVAETKAELPKLESGLRHPYRRKWVTKRKHLPIADVAAAGR